MGALDGRVAIITGAGRGLGREYARLFAREGASVVVNDLGGASDGTGRDQAPADEVVAEITGAGGVAVANHDDVADWDGARLSSTPPSIASAICTSSSTTPGSCATARS